MVVLGNITAAWVFVCLYKMLMHSQFNVPKLLLWKHCALLWGGLALLGAVCCVTDNALFTAIAAFATAGFTCWMEGQARPVAAIGFGLLFGFLRVCSAGAVLFFRQVFPNTGDACAIMADILILYAVTACISAASPRWRACVTPLLWLIPVWLAGVLLCAVTIHFQSTVIAPASLFFGFLWMLYAGARLLQTCSLMEATVQAYLEKQQTVRHYAQQEEYYQQLLQKQAETRALWHDLHKYLRAAKAESPSATALSQLEALLDSATGILDTGNRVVNVILSEYNQAAAAAGIQLRLKVNVPEVLFVSSADLYVLIGNTMDNALEACKALPSEHRLIELTLKTHNDVLYYKLVNPYSQQARPIQKNPSRGYGLQNVRRSVDRYDGVLDITQRNGFFTVSAHLNRK